MDDGFATGFLAGQDSNGGNNGGFFGNEGLWAVIILAIIFGWGRNGLSGSGDNGGGNGMNVLPYLMSSGGLGGADTRTAIADGFAMNNLQASINGVQQGLCDGFYAVNTSLLNGFHGTDNAVCTLGYQTQQGFNTLGAQIASCCCDIGGKIADVKYQMATDTCAIQNTIQTATRDLLDNQNSGTRAILDYLCQDKISNLQAENQALRLAASQQAQNAYFTATQEAQTAELIRRLGRDNPVPAFVVPNPNCCYGNPVGVSYGGNGCGCGC